MVYPAKRSRMNRSVGTGQCNNDPGGLNRTVWPKWKICVCVGMSGKISLGEAGFCVGETPWLLTTLALVAHFPTCSSAVSISSWPLSSILFSLRIGAGFLQAYQIASSNIMFGYCTLLRS